MKKKMNMLMPLAMLSLGVGALMYTYTKKHPVKTKVLVNDVKSMMKDLK